MALTAMLTALMGIGMVMLLIGTNVAPDDGLVRPSTD